MGRTATTSDAHAATSDAHATTSDARLKKKPYKSICYGGGIRSILLILS